MKKIKKAISMLLTFLLLATTYPAQATADLSDFNENDFIHLQNFLNQPSAVPGKLNGEMLNPAYDQNNPETWTGVEWSAETPRYVTKIGEWGSWSNKSLAGSLNLSGAAYLESLDCSYNHISVLNISACPELYFLDCRNNQLSALSSIGSNYINQIFCQNNQISTLDMTNLTNLYAFKTAGNRLTHIEFSFGEGKYYIDADEGGYVELDLYDLEGYTFIRANAVPLPGYELDMWVLVGEVPVEDENPVDLYSYRYNRARAKFTDSGIQPGYTVTFNPNGGERIGGGELVQTVLAGNGAVEPELYRFGYYYRWDKRFSEINGDITVNAIWYPEVSPYPGEPTITPPPPVPTPAVITHTVTFDPNGGTRIGGGYLTQHVPVGDGAYAPKVAREGYTFVGWDVPFNNITDDLNVTAIWQPYTVTFDPNGGTRTGGGELVQKVESGAAAIAPEVVRENHVFDSWDSDFSKVSKDMTVKAIWSLKKLNVTFDPDGGTRTGGGELSQKVEYGGSAIEPILEKKGYTFEDWDMDYSNVTDDLTITALWEGSGPEEEELFTIIYDLNGGDGEAPVDENEYEASKPVPKTGDIPGIAYGVPMLLGGSALVGMEFFKKKRQRNR